MDRHASEGMAIYWATGATRGQVQRSPRSSKEVCSLDGRTKAIDRLQKVCSELDELRVELKESDIEAHALGVLRDTLDQMRAAAWAFQKCFEQSRLSPDKQDLLVLLTNVRMRLASQLNTDLNRDFAAGRIRTDQDGLSVYLLVLNQVMEQLDLMFGGRKAES